MKLIVLDRDGVINYDSDRYIKSAEEWVPIPGSIEAIGRLCQGDYNVVVATNQSGIARGLFDIEALHAMHEKMTKLVAEQGGSVDGIFFCPHAPSDRCSCRKPKPGVLHQIRERLHVNLNDTIMVGDTMPDLQAAWTVGAKAVLVRTGKGEKTLLSEELPKDTPVHRDLAAVADALLEGTL